MAASHASDGGAASTGSSTGEASATMSNSAHSISRQNSRDDDDDDEDDEEVDEEFRRAQEMALAVAALGSSGGTASSYSSYSTATDIRMAVADVMAGVGDDSATQSTTNTSYNSAQQYYNELQEEDLMKLKKQLYAASRENHILQARNEKLQRKLQREKKREKQLTMKIEQQQQQQTSKKQQQSGNFVFYILLQIWNDSIGKFCNPYLAPYTEVFDNKSLQGPNLFIVLFVLNINSLYLSLTTATSSYISFCNTIFVINMTFYICLTTRGKATKPTPTDDECSKMNQMSIVTEPESDEEDEDVVTVQRKSRQQQELLLEAATRTRKSMVSAVRLEWLDGIKFDEGQLHELEQLQPTSTLAERRRFMKARKFCVKAASSQLGTYLKWRQDNRIDDFFPSTSFFSDDIDDWSSAARGALEITNQSGNRLRVTSLPRLVSVYQGDTDVVCCKNGARVVHVLPGQLDSALAESSTYALAVAMYLDRKLSREHTEKVTVVIDIRHGTGWKNPSSVSIVPFIKLVVGLLNTYFPERLSRCILFPLPRTATMLFNTAKTYLDPDTAAKIQVCSGGGSIKSQVPTKVYDFIDQKAVDVMERRRKSFFIIK